MSDTTNVNTSTNTTINTSTNTTPMPEAVRAFLEAVEAAGLPRSAPYYGSSRPDGEGDRLVALMIAASLSETYPNTPWDKSGIPWWGRYQRAIGTVDFCVWVRLWGYHPASW